MNTSDDVSLISTSTRVMRNGSKARVRSDTYLWFFGQIHAKRFFIFVMLYFTYLSLSLLSQTSSPTYTPLGIPGFDGRQPYRKVRATTVQNPDFMTEMATSEVPLPSTRPIAPQETDFQLFRSTENIWSYVALASVCLAGLGLHLSDRNWRPKSSLFIKRVNPGIFLIPMLLIVLSCGYPISIWSKKSYLEAVDDCNSSLSPCTTFFFWLDFTRFVALPVFLVWTFFIYIFFGCFLGFIFIWQRANAEQKARELAAASFRTFRDKDTLLRRPVAHTVGFGKNRSYSVGRNSSLRNTTKGTASRPTLSSIFKVPELNDSRASSASAPGDYAMNDRIDVEVGREVGRERGERVERGSLSRRPLETVVEENESHADSQGSLNKL